MAAGQAESAAANEGAQEFAFGPFVLDLGRGALLLDGTELHLRPKSFDVLCHMVTRAGYLVSREELLDAAWPGLIVTDDSLTQCLIDIRRALGDDRHEIIRTVPRKGYIFELPVQRRAPGDGAAAPSEEQIRRRAESPARRRLAASAALAVAAAVAGLWYFGAFRPAAEVRETPFNPPPHSIAVLPFADLSPGGDREYLADGISEEILNMLTQVPGLTVIARTSSFAFKGTASTVGEIARRLNVAYVLEGSVRTEGDTARVTAQLVSAEKEAHLWSRTFDLPLGSAFDIEGRVAEALAGLMSRALGVEMQVPAAGATRHVPDSSAWDHLLRGRFFYGRRGAGDLERALREFEQAVALDPELADGWAGAAGMRILQALDGAEGYTLDDPKIRTALEHALALDDTNPEALYRMAMIESFAGRHEQARHYFDLAVRHRHNNALMYSVLAGMAMYAGEFERAVVLQRRAAALDPLGYVFWDNLEDILYYAGRFEEAESALRRAVELNRDQDLSPRLFEYALVRRDYAEAGEVASAMPEGMVRDWAEAMLHHLTGDPVESDRALARLQQYSEARARMYLAMAHAVRGETEAAFHSIEATTAAVLAQPRETMEFEWLIHLRDSPILAPLHADPRWSDWVREAWRRMNEKRGFDPAEVFRRHPELGRE